MNNSSDCNECSDFADDEGFQTGPLIVRDVIFLIIGIIGNFCLLTIIFKKMRSVPNYLIANLTVADTGFLLLYLPYEILVNLNQEEKQNFAFIRSQLGCKIFEYFKLVFMGVSISTLTALSVDRYLAVSKPLAFRSVRSGRRRLCAVLGGIALIWIGAFSVCFPNLVIAKLNNSSMTCNVEPWHDFFEPYVYIAVVVYLAAPSCIIMFSYCCMARSLLKRNDLLVSHGSAGNKVSSRQRRQRVRLAIAVIIIVIVFVATWSMHYLTELLRHHYVHLYFDGGRYVEHNWFVGVHAVATMLLRINPVINPIILFAVSSSHRHYAKLTFCCCLPDKSKKHKFGKSISLTAQSTAESRLHKNSESQKTRREMQV